MGINRFVAAVAIGMLALGACGSDDDAADDERTDATTTTVATAADTDDDPFDGDGDPVDGDGDGDGSIGIGTCSSAQIPTASSYAVTGIADDDPDGGLVARQLPGPDEDEIDVLAEGTVVDTRSDADACAVTDQGGVWWEIGTPQLATGGWVNSTFLEAGVASPDTDQDSYDVDKARIACIYEGDTAACDMLELDGITAQGNYGLGNSYSMAPDDAIAEQCAEGDDIACAEQEFRKGGGE